MHELETALAHLRTAWLAGRPGQDAAPPEWRSAADGDELVLLALASQACDVATRPKAGAGLTLRALLPALARPTLPDAHRYRFRRLLATPKNTPSLEQFLISFVAARGFVVHPADWLPSAKDDWAPDLYAPWLDWVRDEAKTGDRSDADLTNETYENWSWTERRKALEAMRGASPSEALAIIAAKAGAEPAERRLRLIEILQIGLSIADAEYLESLLKDRSDRVQILARALLARLGRGSGASELAAELALMVELSKTGLVKRRSQLLIKPLKTGAQQMRRRELLHLVPLAELAAALNAEELQLAESVPEGAFHDTLDFMTCVAQTGSESAIKALVAQVIESKDAPIALAGPLFERLSKTERKTLSPAIIARDADMFETALGVARDGLGQTPLQAIGASPSFVALKTNVEIMARGEDGGRAAATRLLELLLPRAGLLLDAPGASALLAQITEWGLSAADPRLDMLHFNAALWENAT
jgi:hypothetical protein